MVHLSVCLSACRLVTVVHPAKAGGWNEITFGRDTRGPSNIVLDTGPSHPMGLGDVGVGTLLDMEIFGPKTLYNGYAHLYITLNHHRSHLKILYSE